MAKEAKGPYIPQEELYARDPISADLESIFTVKRPLNELARISNTVNEARLAPDQLERLRQELNDPLLQPRATLTLIWQGLPFLHNVLQPLVGLGIAERELVQMGFDFMTDFLQKWGTDKYTLQYQQRFQLVGQRFLKMEIAHHYGIGHEKIDLIRHYIQARDLFADRFGRQAGIDDLEVIRKIINRIEEKTPEQINKEKRKRRASADIHPDNPYAGDPLARIHDFYTLEQFAPDLQALPEPEDQSTQHTEEFHQLHDIFTTIFDDLPGKFKKYLVLKFGLDDSPPLSTEEITDKLGLTRAMARDIEAKALRYLRHPIRSHVLKEYREI